MPPTIPTEEPRKLVAGDSLAWDRTDLGGDYPPGTWALVYYLTGPSTLEVTAGENGTTFEVRVPSSETSGLAPGGYRLRGFVTDGTDRYQVYEGSLSVEEDPAQAAPGGTHAEKMLAAIQATLEGRVTKDVEQYTYDGVSVAKLPIELLEKLEVRYRARVARERAGGVRLSSVRVVF